MRALIIIAASGAAISAGLLTGAASAWAHVHIDADNAAPGSTTVLTFQVPGESKTGALTTQLSVTLPNVTSARAELMPGWSARLDRDTAAGTTSSVTWTAAPGTGISTDQFELFRISVTLPDEQTVSFPTTQTYSDGTVVHWDQAPLPGGGEPEFPAPMLTMSGAQPQTADEQTPVAPAAQGLAPASVEAPTRVDNTARWLAGGALTVAALALVVALVSRRWA